MQSCLKRSRHLLQFCVALTLTDVSVPGHIACCPTVLPVSTCWQCRVVFCDSRTLGHGATLLRRIYCVPLVLGTVKAIQHKMQRLRCWKDWRQPLGSVTSGVGAGIGSWENPHNGTHRPKCFCPCMIFGTNCEPRTSSASRSRRLDQGMGPGCSSCLGVKRSYIELGWFDWCLVWGSQERCFEQ